MKVPSKVLRIDHVQLAMPKGSENRARSFYRDVLSMKEIPKPETLAGRGGCWFASGEAQVHLALKRIFALRKRRTRRLSLKDWTKFSRDAKRPGLHQSRTWKSMGAAAFTYSILLEIAWSSSKGKALEPTGRFFFFQGE